MVLLTGGQKKGKRDRFIKFKYSGDFLFSFFLFEAARRGLRRAGSRKCNFLDGDKGRATCYFKIAATSS